MVEINLVCPDAQIGFAAALKEIRSLYLLDALADTIAMMEIQNIDQDLYTYADHTALNILAAHGMRGELLFALPCVLEENPRLLGYYRLLLGYSQKGFYASTTGAGIFRSMEDKGYLSEKQRSALPVLCKELNLQSKYMLEHFDDQFISSSFFDQLTLLTLGPQLRGGANVQRGTTAIKTVFDIILQIVDKAVIKSNSRYIILRNKAGRIVNIQFSADPDIVIREELSTDTYRNLVAIEVKGGQDYSNIHNRIGEAEKSHQKAKNDGYIECWTVVNVDRVDIVMARKESPTTNQFYRISELINQQSQEYRDFSLQILSIVGI